MYNIKKRRKMRKILWQDIYNKLKEEIERGTYRRGGRFLRIKDICEKFKVSDITARRVLDELEREISLFRKGE